VIDDLKLLDGKGEWVDLFKVVDETLLDEAAQLGDGSPLLLTVLATSASSTAASTTSSTTTSSASSTKSTSESSATGWSSIRHWFELH